MCRTTLWMAWFLLGLAVASACGGDKDGSAAGSGGASASPGDGGSGGRVSASGGESAGAGGRTGSEATAGRAGASGVGGAQGTDDDDEDMQPSSRAGNGGAAAGGSGATSGAGGAGGRASESGGTGGDPGTLETGGSVSEEGGAGGSDESAGTGGAFESGGAGGAAGSGGAGGSDEEDDSADQCVRDAEAAGQTITDCETCLCMRDNCQAEMNAIKDDAEANALATCGKENACAGQCCLCSTDGEGDTCSISNYATGVCADEVERAAGATPGAGLLNVAAVMMNCANAGPADNACARITRLETCAQAKCASECPRVVVPCPPE